MGPGQDKLRARLGPGQMDRTGPRKPKENFGTALVWQGQNEGLRGSVAFGPQDPGEPMLEGQTAGGGSAGWAEGMCREDVFKPWPMEESVKGGFRNWEKRMRDCVWRGEEGRAWGRAQC